MVEAFDLEAWLDRYCQPAHGEMVARVDVNKLAAEYTSRLSAMATELEQAKDLLGGLVDSGGALRQENQSLHDQLEALKTERTRLEGSAVESVRRVAAERDEALKELEAAKSSAALWMKTAERLDKALGPPAVSDTPKAAVCEKCNGFGIVPTGARYPHEAALCPDCHPSPAAGDRV